MGAKSHLSPAVERDQSPVGVAHGEVDALRDGDDGHVRAVARDGAAQRGVGGIVERRGRVVEDEDARAAGERARDGEALALSTGEVAPELLDLGREKAALLSVNDRGGLCSGEFRRLEVLLAGVWPAPAKVGGNGPREEHGALLHERDGRS